MADYTAFVPTAPTAPPCETRPPTYGASVESPSATTTYVYRPVGGGALDTATSRDGVPVDAEVLRVVTS